MSPAPLIRSVSFAPGLRVQVRQRTSQMDKDGKAL